MFAARIFKRAPLKSALLVAPFSSRMSSRKPFNILSLDGGGVRGAFTAGCLLRLEEECPGFLRSFDLIAGTSTGSIIALCLAKGISITDIGEQYRDACPHIFNPDRSLGTMFGLSGNLFASKYSNAVLKGWLASVAPSRRCSQRKLAFFLFFTVRVPRGLAWQDAHPWRPGEEGGTHGIQG